MASPLNLSRPRSPFTKLWASNLARRDRCARKSKAGHGPLGASRLELLEATSDDSPIAKFIAKRGEGLHHVCLRVPDLSAAVAKLKSRNVRLVSEEIKTGAGGHRYVFVHPSSTGGVLLELVEGAPMPNNFDAIVIGAGQAGPALANRLATSGMKVAFAERKLFGGTCVNTGCTPTKAMVASAYAAQLARRGAAYGVNIAGAITVDMKKVKARKIRSSTTLLRP